MKKEWPTKPLHSLCEDVNVGHVGPSSMHRDPDGISFLMGKNVGTGVIYTDNLERVTESFHRLQPKSQLRPGDIVVVRIGKSGQAAKIPDGFGEANCSGLVIVKRPHGIHPDFLVYYLNSPTGRSFSLSQARGSTRLTLNTSSVAETVVPVPPIIEQQRIVGLLDEAFAGLATAQAHAERNLENAHALFDSHLQSVFAQHREKWESVTLEGLLERGWIEGHLDGNHGSDYPRKDEFVSCGVPYISASCLQDERVDMTRAKYLSPTRAALLRKGVAKDGDVLFAHNATVGPVAILRTSEPKVILGTSLTYYRCNPAKILPEYLAHYMRSFGFRRQYFQVMGQSTRNQVPITKQREFIHVIPPLDEQARLVRALDCLFENSQRLGGLYRQRQEALRALKSSLLHQAMSGAL